MSAVLQSSRTKQILREGGVGLYLAGKHAALRDECLRQARMVPNARDLYASSAREHHRLYRFYMRGTI